MTLLDRIAERRCRALDCPEPRLQDAATCEKHLLALYRNQLDRREDGTLVPRRRLPARDESGWTRSAA